MSNRQRAIKLTYSELETLVAKLETENKFLEDWNAELQKAVDKLALFQPPAPIILTTTLEKIEEIKAMVKHG